MFRSQHLLGAKNTGACELCDVHLGLIFLQLLCSLAVRMHAIQSALLRSDTKWYVSRKGSITEMRAPLDTLSASTC
jgi:hypothetical protein